MAIRTLTLATALAFALAAQPAAAQKDEQQGSPGEMAREGVEQLMNAIETFVHSLPMYGAPRLDEEGNIVIPRLDKDEPSQRKPERKPENPERAPKGDGGVTEI
ncbi:MAG: hypothetical protein U5L06_06300 [Rhodovibrio sp.]|nr:hypothetical protein [Rhodovibrio sp.]